MKNIFVHQIVKSHCPAVVMILSCGDHNQVQSGKHHNELACSPESIIGIDGSAVDFKTSHPPLIPITVHKFFDLYPGGIVHPLFRNDLPYLPLTAVEIQLPEFCHISGP